MDLGSAGQLRVRASGVRDGAEHLSSSSPGYGSTTSRCVSRMLVEIGQREPRRVPEPISMMRLGANRRNMPQ